MLFSSRSAIAVVADILGIVYDAGEGIEATPLAEAGFSTTGTNGHARLHVMTVEVSSVLDARTRTSRFPEASPFRAGLICYADLIAYFQTADCRRGRDGGEFGSSFHRRTKREDE